MRLRAATAFVALGLVAVLVWLLRDAPPAPAPTPTRAASVPALEPALDPAPFGTEDGTPSTATVAPATEPGADEDEAPPVALRPERVVARVNGRPLHGADVVPPLADAPETPLPRRLYERRLSAVIDRELAAQEAERRGLASDPAVLAALEAVERALSAPDHPAGRARAALVRQGQQQRLELLVMRAERADAGAVVDDWWDELYARDPVRYGAIAARPGGAERNRHAVERAMREDWGDEIRAEVAARREAVHHRLRQTGDVERYEP